MERTTVLVTGGAGFIGSALALRLAEEGCRVRILDDLSTGSLGNLAGLPGDADVVEGDLLDGALLRSTLNGVSVVFHHAAIASVSRSVEDPVASHRVNATGTLEVLLAARDAGVDRLVYASSSAAYGATGEEPVGERHPTAPTSPYGAAKLSGEQYCRAATVTFGLPTVSLRYFNVFGPRQSPSSGYAAVIPAFASAMIAGEAPVVFGDGLQTRDFVYVDDVVEANLLASRPGNGADGNAFNIGGGRAHSLLDLIGALHEVIGPGARNPVFREPRAGDIRHSLADVGAARDILGFQPQVSLEDGLRRTVAWLASSRSADGSRQARPSHRQA
jgi:UDP-glucose 4-epimerase